MADVVALPPRRSEADGVSVEGSAVQRRLTPTELIRSIGLVGLVRPATESGDRAAHSDIHTNANALGFRAGSARPAAALASVRAEPVHDEPVHDEPVRAASMHSVTRMPSGAASGLNAGNVAGGLGAPERILPVVRALRPLLPGGGLRRGSTVAASGATSLLISLLAAASQAGSWCAIVGMPTLGAIAAAEAGLSLDRLALVPHPGPEWTTVVAALLDGVDVVVAVPPGPIAASMSSRLAARARQRGSVFVAYGHLPGADVVVNSTRSRWDGLGQGNGRLRQREMTIVVHGRGSAAQSRQGKFWAPVLPPLNSGWRSEDWQRLDRNSSRRSLALVDGLPEPRLLNGPLDLHLVDGLPEPQLVNGPSEPQFDAVGFETVDLAEVAS